MDLTLHLTSACNLRCGYCHDATGARRGYRAMSAEVARKAIDLAYGPLLRGEGRRDGVPGFFFYGGEPLLAEAVLREAVGHACRRAEETGILAHLHTTTNGTRLTDEFLAFARASRLFVSLSLDGVREAQDAHRRFADGRSSWEVVDAALRRLISSQPYAPVRSTITPPTVEWLPESFDYLVDRGVRCIVWAVDWCSPWTPSDLDRLERAYRRIAKSYTRRSAERERFYFSPFDGKLSTWIRQDEAPRFKCRLGYQQVSVAPDGSLLPCVEWVSDSPDPSWVIGHVDTGIDERRRFALYAPTAAPKPSCEGCSIEGRCLSWCACLNYRTTGCVDVVSPVVCAHERMLVPLVDELGARLFDRRDPTFLHKHYDDLYPFLSLLEDLSRRRARR